MKKIFLLLLLLPVIALSQPRKQTKSIWTDTIRANDINKSIIFKRGNYYGYFPWLGANDTLATQSYVASHGGGSTDTTVALSRARYISDTTLYIQSKALTTAQLASKMDVADTSTLIHWTDTTYWVQPKRTLLNGTIAPSFGVTTVTTLQPTTAITQSGTAATLDVNPYAQLRFFRSTNNSANAYLTFFKGDGTGTQMGTYFARDGVLTLPRGSFGAMNNAVLDPFRVTLYNGTTIVASDDTTGLALRRSISLGKGQSTKLNTFVVTGATGVSTAASIDSIGNLSAVKGTFTGAITATSQTLAIGAITSTGTSTFGGASFGKGQTVLQPVKVTLYDGTTVKASLDTTGKAIIIGLANSGTTTLSNTSASALTINGGGAMDSIFSLKANAGTATIGAGDSVRVWLNGLTTTGVANVSYRRARTTAATADTICTAYVWSANYLSIYGKFGWAVDWILGKE